MYHVSASARCHSWSGDAKISILYEESHPLSCIKKFCGSVLPVVDHGPSICSSFRLLASACSPPLFCLQVWVCMYVFMYVSIYKHVYMYVQTCLKLTDNKSNVYYLLRFLLNVSILPNSIRTSVEVFSNSDCNTCPGRARTNWIISRIEDFTLTLSTLLAEASWQWLIVTRIPDNC